MNTKLEFLKLVEKEILAVEELMRKQADDHHQEIKAALDILLSSGGKRIRPTVTLLVGNILGAPKEQLLTMAASIEMLHTATLVHDDLIDGSLLRRGMPTLNAHWSPGATILTGDFLFSRAASLAAAAESTPVMKVFADTLSVIVNGEIAQMFSGRCIHKRDDYYQRIYAKTASLFQTAAWTSAMISKAPEETVNKMRDFGHQIGMAFQIIDDILDFTGDQVTVGKPVGNDLRQGIITLPTLIYVEGHKKDPDVQFILNNNCDQMIEDEQMDRLINSIRSSQAIQAAYAEAKGYIQNGLSEISDQPKSAEKSALTDLANYIIDRDI